MRGKRRAQKEKGGLKKGKMLEPTNKTVAPGPQLPNRIEQRQKMTRGSTVQRRGTNDDSLTQPLLTTVGKRGLHPPASRWCESLSHLPTRIKQRQNRTHGWSTTWDALMASPYRAASAQSSRLGAIEILKLERKPSAALDLDQAAPENGPRRHCATREALMASLLRNLCSKVWA